MWCLYLFFNISNQNQTTYTANNTNNQTEHGNNERKYLKIQKATTLRLLQMIIISVFFIKLIIQRMFRDSKIYSKKLELSFTKSHYNTPE